ncbi:hypothetical protein DEU56DRAFT_798244 [Suillus clintonianus]|uniref:uncharacterized protein n=1 Tax=Suillus clintonianus TaxID=1904413 RepID=UPI001B85F337|nr:uncharacterized protein DEU56DRAFT_798244 [Suillus clintonianus]KAG2140688.1 hypothetical protein DEU56DRAFT_798244 [Suillus clintonianus]
MTIRTYALYGGNKHLLIWMTIIMISLAVAVSVGSLGHFSGNTDQTVFSAVGCNETYTAETYYILSRWLGLAWMAELVFELLIFVLIVYRICKTRGLLRLSLFTRRNIINIIFHDAMALVNIPNILTFYVSRRMSIDGISKRSHMSVTLISRLMLNLHKTIDTGICSTPARDDGPSLAVLTTMVNVQSPVSSHDW